MKKLSGRYPFTSASRSDLPFLVKLHHTCPNKQLCSRTPFKYRVFVDPNTVFYINMSEIIGIYFSSPVKIETAIPAVVRLCSLTNFSIDSLIYLSTPLESVAIADAFNIGFINMNKIKSTINEIKHFFVILITSMKPVFKNQAIHEPDVLQ